jgi:protein-S-isoprenylcysteine O-methyltransferase Ste14
VGEMDVDILCKVILIVVFTLFSIIRIQYQRLAKKAKLRTIIEESKKYSIFLSILICYEVFTLFLWLLYPEAIAFGSITMSSWLRYIGVVLGIGALLLFVWVHQNLGKYFTTKLRITAGHNIINTGPYRWVRHPMYTAFYILHVASFLLSANWFIGVTWTAGLTIIMFLRVKREEAMMLDAFGEHYLSYMERTGRFLPRASLWIPFNRKN